MTTDYEFHPIANVFPMMSEEELDGLIIDVREHGLRDPIVLYEDKVLDGRNRYVACFAAGVTRRFTTFDGDDPVAFVVSHNLKRRNLSASQLAVVALDLLPLAEAEAKKRQVRKPADSVVAIVPPQNGNGKARDVVAAQVGAGARYVSDAKRIARDAPDLLAPMRAGTMTVPEAKREAAKRPAAATQRAKTPTTVYRVGDWDALAAADRAAAIASGRTTTAAFNRTNENIEWAGWSWNPITGCLHDCPYCYARDMANRYPDTYPYRFEPTFIPARLSGPKNTVPGSSQAGRGVFVCSMADLLGKWVPREWIDAVLAVTREQPQWTYILLTKNPARLADFTYTGNVWIGTTVDRQARVRPAEDSFDRLRGDGCNAGAFFVSCEPMLERLTFTRLDVFDWVIMGGGSKSTKTPEYHVHQDDRDHLYAQVRAAGCMWYEKTNWWGVESRIREWPHGA